MRSEARIVASLLPQETLIEVGSATKERTLQAIAALLAAGATHLLSFGLAGGLSATLRPGDVIAPERIIGPGGRSWSVDTEWRSRLQLPAAVSAEPMLGSDKAVASTADKSACHRETGAAAVDMESHLLAGAANGRPLLVLRAIADPAERSLPAAALMSLRANGTPDLRRLLAELATHPAQIGPLIRLGRDARAAHAALGRVARMVGSRLIP